MKRSLCLMLVVLSACGPVLVEPDVDAGMVDAGAVEPSAPVRVRVATFNVKLFFDTVCQSGSCTSADFEAVPTATQFEARADQIAQAITSLDADVIALEEFETQTCLDAVLSRLANVMPHGVLGEIGTPGSVDVAIVSRTPLDGVVGHRNLERLTRPDGSRTNFSREFLEAHTVTASGAKVVLFAAHFRSKVQDDPGRRLAEAQTARRIVQDSAAVNADALVVLGGDLNDTPGSAPLDALMLDGGLIRAAADLPAADQVTYLFFSSGEVIDHVLQAKTPAASVVPRSARVWKNGRGWGGSDHFALTADFDVTPQP